MQPLYGRDLWDVGPALSNNLQDVQTSCRDAALRLKQSSGDVSILSGLVGLSCCHAHMTLLCMYMCCFMRESDIKTVSSVEW